MSTNLSEFLANEEQLLAEAAESLPHTFTQCTYALGSLKQSVHLCVTCGSERGICDACSIACHTDHIQIQLFAKRSFRCDCPTSALAHPCCLHTTATEPVNVDNKYGPNYRGLFCRCLRTYDAETEKETMVQCLGCEDWFHESCLNLRERPEDEPEVAVGESAATVLDVAPAPLETEAAAPAPNEEEQVDDGASDASSSGLPPPLICGDSYDTFICGSCVSGIPTLKRWAGTPGTLMAVRESVDAPWTVLDPSTPSPPSKTQEEPEAFASVSISTVEVGEKRPLSPKKGGGPAKRARPMCTSPAVNEVAQLILSGMEEGKILGSGDVFLKDGWRERWCQCDECYLSLMVHPYLLEEEETYETPEDPDCGLSLEELGMRALGNLPRERALDGITAFNAMRDDLFKHLRTFAAEGKVVEVADVNAFFDKLKESKSK